jgi:hypothetical protein
MAKRRPKVKGYDWGESCVFKAIEAAYPDRDRHVVVPQIPDATSFSKCRTLDAMMFSCWRSEGIAVHGFEIKVSRGDWKREIDNPEKSLGFLQRCNYFWIAAPEGIVRLEELPATWGLRECFKNEEGFSSKIRRVATHNPNAAWDVSFIVALARACYRKSPDRIANQADVDAAYERGRQHEKIDRRAGMPWNQQRYLKEFEDLKDAVAKFESASGISITERWNDPGNIGKQLDLFQRVGDPQMMYQAVVRNLERLLEDAKGLAAPPGPADPKPLQVRRDAKLRDRFGLDEYEEIPEDIKPFTDQELMQEVAKLEINQDCSESS